MKHNNPTILLVKELLRKRESYFLGSYEISERIIVLYVCNKQYYTLTIYENEWIIKQQYFLADYKSADNKWYYNSTFYDQYDKYKGDSILDKHHSKYPSIFLINSKNIEINEILKLLDGKRIISIEIFTKCLSPYYRVVYKCLEIDYNYYDLKNIVKIQRLYKDKFYKLGGKGYIKCKKKFEILQ
jgi:hypothetical protein